MPQFFPNFTKAAPVSGSPAPIQTASATGVTNASTGQLITITWDTPFADANYAVHIGIESNETPGTAESAASVSSYTKTASAISVWVANITTGKHFTVNAVGFHV